MLVCVATTCITWIGGSMLTVITLAVGGSVPSPSLKGSSTLMLNQPSGVGIIEKQQRRLRDDDHYIHGSAANIDVLKEAGIMKSPAVVITSHDDDLNVYLTIYCRKLRPDIQIIARAITERNIETLHRAGADVVLSYASMAANAIFNQLKRSDVIMLAEGLDLFRMEIPRSLAGRKIADMNVRKETGCTIAAYILGGDMIVNPDPHEPLPGDCQIIIIGSDEAEDKFLKLFT